MEPASGASEACTTLKGPVHASYSQQLRSNIACLSQGNSTLLRTKGNSQVPGKPSVTMCPGHSTNVELTYIYYIWLLAIHQLLSPASALEQICTAAAAAGAWHLLCRQLLSQISCETTLPLSCL